MQCFNSRTHEESITATYSQTNFGAYSEADTASQSTSFKQTFISTNCATFDKTYSYAYY
jgi:hypothetical protein